MLWFRETHTLCKDSFLKTGHQKDQSKYKMPGGDELRWG